jgi:hypothetical protein
MCLKTVDKKTKKVEEGWKIFKKDMRPQYFQDRIMNMHSAFITPVPVGKWVQDFQDIILVSGCGVEYQTGFHFYFNKDIAITEMSNGDMLRKVKVRKVVATGVEYGFISSISYVGVAREIFVIEEEVLFSPEDIEKVTKILSGESSTQPTVPADKPLN